MNIRETTDADLPVLAGIMNAVNPRHPVTAELLGHELRSLREHPLNPYVGVWLAEEGGRAVGTGFLMQPPGMFHPGRYWAEVMVLPEATGRGVGRALADILENCLAGRGAREVQAGAYEDEPRGLAFLTRRGFTETMRYFDNVLDLTAFDPAAWVQEARLPEGLRAVSLAGLIAEQGEDAAWRAYHSAFAEAREDVPRTGAATPLSFETFRERGAGPTFLPWGVLLAVTDAGEVVALSEMYADPTDATRINTGLTGTRRAWRRQGLGLALKLAALGQARERGIRTVWTNNATTNLPMLALNERLGFRPRPAFIEMRRGSVEGV
ncbi:N-acetyltransferase GCN5 [Deinococcus aerius]|uniref:N-acetyltransferase GCN5 n=1 Tax=Deinococcus aerius TaxID=200253 RepID=A0A2I9E0N1_9DEIO|nr:GNAT family N-acetyltransferase [Deinococcus aerius]GBF07055.1 N-acetyltransferase GCN5 [Deinococcus aerius]